MSIFVEKKTERQTILDGMVASLPLVQIAFKFVTNAILMLELMFCWPCISV